ncbi:MAG: PilZ domain-containing protein [Magnetococcales bacterium]|nr:PilZ domain-containing protein [Magnetococcales bacterium]
MTIQDAKQQRRYQREQVLEEGTLTVGTSSYTVDVLDVSLDSDPCRIHGFGIMAPHQLMAKKSCLLQLNVTRYKGHYECEVVYCQDSGFGMRCGLVVLAKMD